jgi:hypothetical protein
MEDNKVMLMIMMVVEMKRPNDNDDENEMILPTYLLKPPSLCIRRREEFLGGQTHYILDDPCREGGAAG